MPRVSSKTGIATTISRSPKSNSNKFSLFLNLNFQKKKSLSSLKSTETTMVQSDTTTSFVMQTASNTPSMDLQLKPRAPTLRIGLTSKELLTTTPLS
jgi:hypothetical protein